MDVAPPPALLEDGRFEVTRCIGSGGFGVVFAAHDTRTGADVALKWLRHGDATTIARFKREFRSLANIVHPNLVAFRELICVGGEWFFTMDLVDGSDLLTWVRPASPGSEITTRSEGASRGRAPSGSAERRATTGDTASRSGSEHTLERRTLPPPESAPPSVLPISGPSTRPLCAADLPRLRAAIEQLAAGLNALHSAGMLHRDVKPSNVLVTREGRVVLLDFGLVTQMGRNAVAQTKTGRVVGTPAYMSPEQAMGGRVTPASDWYAVGAILFQALTGKVPFEGNAAEVLLQKQLADAPRPSAVVRGLPRRLSQLCKELLARAPEQRPTYPQLIQRLREALPSPDLDGSAAGSSRVVSTALVSARRSDTFVGRETHLCALAEAADEAERGKPVVALVHGTSGMGKTALVRRFLDTLRAERPTTVILEGRCYERESIPYQAIDSLVDALCRHLQRLPPIEAVTLLPRRRDHAALARMFPAFLQLEAKEGAQRQASGDAVEERQHAFEAFREVIARVTDRSPVVLFIDDLQWGDGDSEPLLTELFRPPDPPPLLLIAAYRSEDATTSPLVGALRRLASFAPSVEVCEIPVAELSPEAARGLAASLLGPAAGDERVEELARESLGSPLFLHQLAAAGTSNRLDLASALTSRLARASDEARRLLEVVAVSGKPLPLAVAARAAGIERDAQSVLAPLRAESLVRTRGVDARDEIEIYHDRIREVVIGALSDEDVRERHRALAVALSSAGGDAEELARHHLAAGDRAVAAEYAEKAGDRAASALAFTRAARMYRMAIDAGSTLGPGSPELEAKLDEALRCAGRSREAVARFLLAARDTAPVEEHGRLREASRRIAELVAEARSRGDSYGEALLRLQCSWLVALAEDKPARAEAELTLGVEDRSDDRGVLQRAWRMMGAVAIALYEGDPQRALDEVDRHLAALEGASPLRTGAMQARLHNAIGRAALAAAAGARARGDEHQAAAHRDTASRSARLLAAADWSLAEGLALLLEAGVQAETGQNVAAIALYKRAADELADRGARLYAIAARARHGALTGGDEGAAVVRAAFDELTKERVARPYKMLRVFAPGPDVATSGFVV